MKEKTMEELANMLTVQHLTDVSKTSQVVQKLCVCCCTALLPGTSFPSAGINISVSWDIASLGLADGKLSQESL